METEINEALDKLERIAATLEKIEKTGIRVYTIQQI